MNRRFPANAAARLGTARALDRRAFLRNTAVLGIGGAMLAACSTNPSKSQPGKTAGSGSSDEMMWANWPLSVDTADDGTIPSLVKFKKQTGIEVAYPANINSNDEWYAKVEPLMASGQGIEASLMSPTGWLGARFIAKHWAEKLDTSQIPNSKNLLDAFAHPAFDKDRAYSLAWQGWLVGIAVNTDVTGRDVHSVKDLLTASDLRGKVALLTEMRETTGTLMLANGHDPSDFTKDQFDQALEDIAKAKQRGQLRRFTGNDYASDLAKGNVGACFAWAGDVVQLHKDNPKIKFFAPDSGSVLMEDTLMIPTHAANPDGALKLIDFYYEPDNAAQVASYVNAVCPVKGAQDAMGKIDPELAKNELIFPTASMRKQMHSYMALSLDDNQSYQSAFDKAIGL